jgi:hypothetical protein
MTMETQQDNNDVRVIALANLEAMCEYVSDVCHRYWIEEQTKTHVVVGYSNPDEYGNDDPVFATYPCYPSILKDDEGNPRVVLDQIHSAGWYEDPEDYPEAYQCFDRILDCPVLFRNPTTGKWAEGNDL